MDSTKDYRTTGLSREQSIENFIRDNALFHGLMKSKFGHDRISCFSKIKVTDRFFTIYELDTRDIFHMEDYKFRGIYDKEKDQLIETAYNLEYDLAKIESKLLSEISIESLKEELKKNINDEIHAAAIRDVAILKDEAKEAFKLLEDYEIQHIDDKAKSYFILNDCCFLQNNDDLSAVLKITDGIQYRVNNLDKEKIWSNNSIILNYLEDKDGVIKRESDKHYTDGDIRKGLGLFVLKAEKQAETIKQILKNPNGKYDLLYKKKELIESIGEKDAINLILMISYGKDTLEFKFPKDRLMISLKDPNDSCVGDWGKSYDPVKSFLRNHKNEDRHNDDFDFQNISMIKYSGKIIYEDKSLTVQNSRKHDRKQVLER